MMLTREQVEKIIDQYELAISAAVGSDGVNAVDLLKSDASQRQRIAELEADIKELGEWKGIIEGTGTDHEAVVRMAATEYTKVAVQCWKDKVKQLEAEVANWKAKYEAIVTWNDK